MLKALKCDICRNSSLTRQGDIVETLVDMRKSEMSC